MPCFFPGRCKWNRVLMHGLVNQGVDMQRLPLLCSALMALAISLPAWGQGGMGSIEGDVLDPAGAVITDVTVTATNVETQLVRTATTNSSGRYALLRLPPGTYTISVEHAGFKRLDRPGIQVQVGDRITLNMPLQIGQVSDSVSVVGEAPMVRT